VVDITYLMAAVVEDGPTISLTDVLDTATAYSYVETTVAADDTTEVDVHPGDAGDVVLFFMYSNVYDDLSYTVDGGGSIDFDAPVCLIGAGPAELLGATCNTLIFTNGSLTHDSLVRILVAWVAEDV